MNDFFLKILIVTGFIVGWILGGETLKTSKARIKHKNLLEYLIGE